MIDLKTEDTNLGSIEIEAEFPERPKIGDVIYLQDFIDESMMDTKESSFASEYNFKITCDRWDKDKKGVYLVLFGELD